MFSAPCPYASLSDYDWASTSQSEPPPGCSVIIWNPVVFFFFTTFQVCTLFIGVDLHVQLFCMFRRKKTLYFWSLLFAMWGVLFFTAAVLIILLGNVPTAATILSNVGWVVMTTGFQFVLYSRLSLVNPGKGVLRTALYIITADAILFHGIVILSAVVGIVHPTAMLWRFSEAVRFTEIAFTVQESVLTTLYVYYFLQYTRESQAKSETKITLQLLIAAEFVVFSTDIVLIVLLYTSRYLPRAMIQPFCSALKVKIEFIVLNSLVDYSKSMSRSTALPSWVSEEGAVTAVTTQSVQL